MQVSVANGQRMMSTSVCHDFKWSFQNEVFISDVMLLPLGGCEMVLGIQWLATLGDMQCNFKKLIMKFNHKGRELVLRGINNTHLCQIESVESVSVEVEQVLTQFDEVFKVPKDLPPQRSHDHQIPLMPNTPPINVRPYKHPPNQKDAIEGMVKELMDSGVIRAIKDKFPIPVIEELIDELNGSVVFSKLDLRSGYHQIRMKEDDICKTAFRTHEGHYEFLVMPFGLTNAPLTFQSLMNTVFKAFLRKFVLVFFDDILIYSKNLKEHLEYLGHIISAQGVSIDLSKIEAMQKWPIPSTLKHLRGFLGLTGYYRRFIKDYASISQPLVALTKKDTFKWNPSAELAYHNGKGIGAVMCQNGHPIAYWSKTLSAKHQALSTYEKEFLAVVLTTPFQFKWLPKLLGYDYEIVYKKGSENVVADALSRMDSSGEFLQIYISSVSIHFYDEAIGGHSGAHVTMKKLGSLFCFKGFKKMVKIWKEISMDFIEKLPTFHGKSMIMVVVDRLSKDKVFLSNFWKALFAELKVKLKLSTAYHPQTDGQTEVVNKPGMLSEVYLKLQPHKQVSIRQDQQHKLSSKYYGPFKVAERIGEVAYRLELPSSSQIHLVFHISQLKKCHGKVHIGPNKPVEDVTWETMVNLITRFLGFDAVNEVVP
ncbi:reverse transcriptase [Tanacetum coccineum]